MMNADDDYQPAPGAALSSVPEHIALYELTEHIHRVGYHSNMAIMVVSLEATPNLIRLADTPAAALRRAIGTALSQCLRPKDAVYPLERWEWLCILPELPGDAAVILATERVRKALAQAAQSLGLTGLAHPQCGIAFLHTGGEEARPLLDAARIALQVAKREQRPWNIYHERQERQEDRTAQSDEQLAEALQSNEGIALHLAPQIDLASGQCTAAIAIPLLPGGLTADTLPAALQRQGLAGDYLQWLLQQSGQLARTLSRHAGSARPLPIYLPLREDDLHDPELPAQATQIFALHDIAPAQAIFSLPEHALSNGNERLKQTLRQLLKAGFGYATSGFSPLLCDASLPAPACLRLSPWQTSRLANAAPLAATLLGGLIATAAERQLPCCADGVSTPEQIEYLQQHGVPQASGSLYGKPLPVAAFIEWLAERSAP